MHRERTSGQLIRLLRVPSSFALCAAGAILLAIAGIPKAAVGIAIGFGLHLVNLLFLVETTRSATRADSSRWGAWAVGGGAAARFLLLGAGLAAVGLFLGREAVLGGCGGLLVPQVNLRVPRRAKKGTARRAFR